MTSIRRQLLLWLLAAALSAGAIATVSVYYLARTQANQLFDYHLKQIALSFRDQTFAESDLFGTLEEDIDYDFVIQVWSGDGVRRYFSHPHKALPPRAAPGYASITTDEGAWRVFSLQERGLTIQVAQPVDVRHELAAKLALRMVVPLVLLLPAVGLVIWIVVGRGLRPLDHVAQALRERNPNALQALPDGGLPVEIKPLVVALNALLRRLERALQAQKAFIADAAHELRTPLAALKLQMQLAERAQDENARGTAFAQLRGGLERSIHLVQQLLTLARQDPEAAQRPFAEVSLNQLAASVVAEHAPLAQTKQIDLGIARDQPAKVSGDVEALRAMLGNLIDNAIRHTPEGGRVDVGVFEAEGSAIIEVCDTGEGIPPAERERVFDRFYRREAAGVSGSGLGLAIVKNVVELHGGTVKLQTGEAGKGLNARVELPGQLAAA